MTRFELRDVLDSTGASLVRGEPGVEVCGVSTDSRTLRPGELFLALSGPNFDGNDFAPKAIEAGAAAVLLRGGSAQAPPDLPGTAALAVHPDPRRALGDLAAWHRSRLEVPVIGVTGSCGKTTTKDILAELLAVRGPVVASPSSFNNDIGVPHTLLLADDETEALVVELGTNHRGEIGALCRIARPTCGVITNVGAAHLEGLGSLEGVAQEKGDLAEALPLEGFLVLNQDCRFTPELRLRTGAQVITFSVEGEGDFDARDIVFHSGGTTFRLNGHEITSPLLGTHNIQNLLAALAVCTGLAIPLDEVLPAVVNIRGGSQRLERVELEGLTVFDDTWNSNPDSSLAAVRCLSGMHGFQRRILVLGDMLELGELAAELHHGLGAEAARSGIDFVVLVGELSKAAAAGAIECGMPAESLLHVATTDEAVAIVPEIVCDGDVVLVKGSRKLGLERIVARLAELRGARRE
ncbi:MAG: UDP-N-acetylmuramoyl-tripeptide--D-alanyl-D-alanine ligase [Planctomycetota bacterium]|nr:UDP-N-acetylmuramoyl-tripeptide--D-alanyl-D-alanine ligase [Planctomycetota bacterium]